MTKNDLNDHGTSVVVGAITNAFNVGAIAVVVAGAADVTTAVVGIACVEVTTVGLSRSVIKDRNYRIRPISLLAGLSASAVAGAFMMASYVDVSKYFTCGHDSNVEQVQHEHDQTKDMKISNLCLLPVG